MLYNMCEIWKHHCPVHQRRINDVLGIWSAPVLKPSMSNIRLKCASSLVHEYFQASSEGHFHPTMTAAHREGMIARVIFHLSSLGRQFCETKVPVTPVGVNSKVTVTDSSCWKAWTDVRLRRAGCFFEVVTLSHMST